MVCSSLRYSMSDEFPPEDGDASRPVLTDQQKLAESIERDFRALFDSLGLYQSIVDPAVVSQVETVKRSVERGIDLSLRLRNMTESER